jgi:hypothetical protein
MIFGKSIAVYVLEPHPVQMKTGRPRSKICATEAVKAEIGRRIKKESNALLRDRLRAVQLAFDGTRRYEDIARQTGRRTGSHRYPERTPYWII